jgi:hypothetical protein
MQLPLLRRGFFFDAFFFGRGYRFPSFPSDATRFNVTPALHDVQRPRLVTFGSVHEQPVLTPPIRRRPASVAATVQSVRR